MSIATMRLGQRHLASPVLESIADVLLAVSNIHRRFRCEFAQSFACVWQQSTVHWSVEGFRTVIRIVVVIGYSSARLTAGRFDFEQHDDRDVAARKRIHRTTAGIRRRGMVARNRQHAYFVLSYEPVDLFLQIVRLCIDGPENLNLLHSLTPPKNLARIGT